MKKIKVYSKMFIVLVFVVACMSFIITSIIDIFKSEKFDDINELQEYMIDENRITSYTTFYSVESAVNNFISACTNKKYKELYDIIDKKYKKSYSNDEVKNILDGYNSMYFPEKDDPDDFEIYSNLKNIYYTSDNKYLCEIETVNSNFYIIIDLITNNTYNVILVDMEG